MLLIGEANSRFGWLLLPLMALLPFELREVALALPGMRITVLEGVAGAIVSLVAWERRHALLCVLRRPPGPLLLLLAFVGAHWLSAAAAEAPRALPLKFSLRMTACALFAFTVTVCERRLQRAGALALASSALVVAALAVLEGIGATTLDPVLDLFRKEAVFVGATRRATAGSEHPNLAAAFLVNGLLIWAGLLGSRMSSLPALALIVAGLLLTFSRGGLIAAGVSLVAFLLSRARSRRTARSGVWTLALLVALSAVLAWSSEAFRLRLQSLNSDDWFSARYRLAPVELRLEPGASRRLAVEVENVGRASWPAIRGVELGQRWLELGARALHDGPGARLPHDVPPGGRARMLITVEAPSQPGRYQLILDLKLERERWFSEMGVAPAVAGVLVSAEPEAGAAAVTQDQPLTDVLRSYWRPTRAELTHLALDMWRDRPLLGVGPDNFRRLHTRYGGRHYDISASASNAFLEIAATTGSIGLAAFVALLIALVRKVLAALRGAVPESDPAAWAVLLLGLTVAVIAYASLDYLLAGTGHYLLFGFLVGAVARAGSTLEEAVRSPSR